MYQPRAPGSKLTLLKRIDADELRACPRPSRTQEEALADLPLLRMELGGPRSRSPYLDGGTSASSLAAGVARKRTSNDRRARQ
eukprot:15347252-Alexandrium_andersonii.AAC.1